MGKETLSSIAKRLGISVTTASRALSGNAEKFRISKETVDRVLAEARRCDYIPCAVAQSLRLNRTGTIGLCLPSVSNPYFADIASKIIFEARKYGRSTIVSDAMENPDYQREAVCDLVARKVDGIIISPCGEDLSLLEMINRDHVPVVLVDRYFETSSLSYVTTNNFQGGLDATRQLIAYGHKNIVCIQGVPTSLPNRRRVEGYVKAMNEAGLGDFVQVVGNDFSISNGYLETKLLLGRESRPSAVFALSNTILLGVVKAMHETGLTIPEDLSVISFDNNIYLDYIQPAITRVSQPTDDMAALATKILFEKMDGANGASSHLALTPTIINGGSICRNQG